MAVRNSEAPKEGWTGVAVRMSSRLVRVGRINACVCRAGVVVACRHMGVTVDESAYSTPAVSVVGEGDKYPNNRSFSSSSPSAMAKSSCGIARWNRSGRNQHQTKATVGRLHPIFTARFELAYSHKCLCASLTKRRYAMRLAQRGYVLSRGFVCREINLASKLKYRKKTGVTRASESGPPKYQKQNCTK